MTLQNVTTNEFLRRFPHASKSTIALNSQPSSPQPQCAVCDEPVAEIARKEENPSRLRVRVISLRRRLIDPDNLCPKYFIDCLRYAQIIPNDRAQDIVLEVSQEKVKSKRDECTRIEIGQTAPAKFSADMSRPQLIEYFWDQCGSAWNRPAFDALMETLSDNDLRYYISHGTPEKS